MSTTRVREYLEQLERDGQVQEFGVSSATAGLAVETLRVEPARIAETVSLKDESGCTLIVAADDGEINNPAFKRHFGMKTRILVPEEMEELTSYCVGGTCPFDNPEGARAHLDESLR